MSGILSDNVGRSTGLIKAASGAKIGQVLNAIKTDIQNVTSASYVDVTDLTLAITPVATSSKILWTMCVCGNGDDNMWCKVTYGDDSELTTTAIADARGSRERSMTGGLYREAIGNGTGVLQGLDAPNTTSETTYKVRMRGLAGNTAYLGHARTDTNNAGYGSNSCTLTVMEVLA
jgi:hypothetical protein